MTDEHTEVLVRKHIDLVKAYGDLLFCKASASNPTDAKSWGVAAERVLANVANSARAILAQARAELIAEMVPVAHFINVAPAGAPPDWQQVAKLYASDPDAVPLYRLPKD